VADEEPAVRHAAAWRRLGHLVDDLLDRARLGERNDSLLSLRTAIDRRDTFWANVTWLIIRESVRSRDVAVFAEISDLVLPLLDTPHKLYSSVDSSLYTYAPEAARVEPKVVITGVSERLAAAVGKDPKMLHTLDSRAFEELMADVVKSFGYKTELTARTRDGGRDIIAIGDHNDVRSRLLIECKRYAPSNPVGVELVRSLYGVKVHEQATKALMASVDTQNRPLIDTSKPAIS
jgi:hypothetical protein